MRSLIERLTHLQIHRPLVPLTIVAVVTLVFAFFASQLELRTRYEALLPDSQPSVQELRRIETRTASAQTVLLVLEGDDRAALRALGDALVERLRTLDPSIVSSAEDGIQNARDFLAPRAALFLDRAELEKLQANIDARWDWEVSHQTGFAIDDDPPPPLDTEQLKSRLATSRWPDGYYESADGKALVVVAHSPVAGGDLGAIETALHRIERAVDEVRASRSDFASIRIGYAGDMPTGFVEYGVVRDDLLSVGGTGIALVLLVVLLYFMRLRALVVMGITIAVGLVWTFGLTQIAIGHLNIATGFLISIVAGNGINVGILYQARYFEERRRGVDPEEAVRIAVRTTWQPTVIAALAAAASYGSLLVTDFRAFRHFGFIAASGMLLCWIVKTLMVPPLLLLVDRKRSISGKARGLTYGAMFAGIVPRMPRAILVVAAAIAALGTVASVRWVASDPMEYDLARVQNDRAATAELHRVWDVANGILGSSQGAMVVLADSPDEAKELHQKLAARWSGVTSIHTFVPSDQESRIPIAIAISDRIRRAHERGFVSDEDWARVRSVLAPHDLEPLRVADLPASIAGPFTDKSGARGTLVFVEAEPDKSEDLHYLIRYSSAFRETKLDSGKVVRGSGRAVIFADILQAVISDIPKAVSLSLGMTIAVVLFTFRRGLQSAAVLGALAVAIACIGGVLYFARVRLNFLNFAALPITFGIGVDYAVNVAQRYDADGRKDIVDVLRTTGGAVVLCSLTTTLGYVALLRSHNQAIRSLGLIAVVGEVACLLAAVLFLPAFWLVLERRRQQRSAS